MSKCIKASSSKQCMFVFQIFLLLFLTFWTFSRGYNSKTVKGIIVKIELDNNLTVVSNQIKEFNDLYPIKLKLSHRNQYHLFIFMFNATFNNISHFKGFYLYFIILSIGMDGGGCFQGHTNIKYLYF